MRATVALADWPTVGTPLTLTITSPGLIIARAAGEPGKTCVTVRRPALWATATPIPE
jgi:hypothetical protein